jgi:hypothetical protein
LSAILLNILTTEEKVQCSVIIFIANFIATPSYALPGLLIIEHIILQATG